MTRPKEFRGEDQQLDRAIQEIQQEMKTKRLSIALAAALSESKSGETGQLNRWSS